MYCKYCKQEKPDDEFRTDKIIYGVPYIAKRCKSCREQYLEKKALKQEKPKKNERKNNTTKCMNCGKLFETTYDKNKVKHARCPVCRKKHALEQKNSRIKIRKDEVNKLGIGLFNEESLINTKEFMNIVADKLVNKLLGRNK